MFYFKKHYPQNFIINSSSCHGFHGVFQADVVFFSVSFPPPFFFCFSFPSFWQPGFFVIAILPIDSEIENIYK